VPNANGYKRGTFFADESAVETLESIYEEAEKLSPERNG
jgi:hypothetical protein